MRDKVKAEEEVERILNLLDTNQSGKIDYSGKNKIKTRVSCCSYESRKNNKYEKS